MPAATTGETAKQLDGHAAVQIDCRLGAERAIACPAPHGMLLFSVGFHAFSLRPTEGESPIRKDPRGDLRGAREELSCCPPPSARLTALAI
jgi:hypothetical protein